MPLYGGAVLMKNRYLKHKEGKMFGFQGDVLLIKVDSIPRGKKIARKERGLVLAEGESTGHAHVITDNGAELYEKDGKMYLSVEKEVTLNHEEHNAVKIAPGKYEVRIAKEYDHFLEESRRVAD